MATVVIGLGSNLKEPLQQLRTAVKKLSEESDLRIQAYSPIYLSKPLLAGQPDYLNAAIRLETTLSPRNLLAKLKKIEKEMGRVDAIKWDSRIIDLDILCYDQLILDEADFKIPHPELQKRIFAVTPLLDVWPEYQHPTINLSALTWADSLKKLPHLLKGPQMVGILNVTPDSFSDGGQYQEAELAQAQALRLFDQGADVIDIGAESTRPQANLIDTATEWQRLEPVLQALQKVWGKSEHRPLISIDTRHAITAEKSLAYGIDWINNQSQAEFEAMIPLIKAHHLKYVAMHHCGVPPKAEALIQDGPLKVLMQFQTDWQTRFDEQGLDQKQLILDPGIGFGKTPLHHLQIFKEFQRLTARHDQWMIGHSRKSFLKRLFPEMNIADTATAVISGYLGDKGMAYLRVHEPDQNIAAIQLNRLLS